MTLWWLGTAVLLLVVVPVVGYLLNGVLQIAATAAAGSKDLDAATLLVTTRGQVEQTIAAAANYGGSLDVILDDAEEER